MEAVWRGRGSRGHVQAICWQGVVGKEGGPPKQGVGVLLLLLLLSGR